MPPKAKAPNRDRSGYYSTPHGRFMSVTTVLSNGVPKPNLVHWAASEVAKSALENIPELTKVRGQAARKEAYDWLRRAPETRRDKAAALGTAVHDVVEAKILDAPLPDVTAEQQPYVDAFHRFEADWKPVWEATELVVANPDDGWAGTADWWATIPGLGNVMVLGDWKTGKGVYPEAALQLSCYRRATVGWTADGTEVVPPSAERAVVVHLRPEKYPDTGYRIIPLDTSDETYAFFKAAQIVASYKKAADGLLGEAFADAA